MALTFFGMSKTIVPRTRWPGWILSQIVWSRNTTRIVRSALCLCPAESTSFWNGS